LPVQKYSPPIVYEMIWFHHSSRHLFVPSKSIDPVSEKMLDRLLWRLVTEYSRGEPGRLSRKSSNTPTAKHVSNIHVRNSAREKRTRRNSSTATLRTMLSSAPRLVIPITRRIGVRNSHRTLTRRNFKYTNATTPDKWTASSEDLMIGMRGPEDVKESHPNTSVSTQTIGTTTKNTLTNQLYRSSNSDTESGLAVTIPVRITAKVP
jgi:hypothetical protein